MLRCPVWGAHPSLLREKLQVLSFLPVEDYHAEGGGGVYGDIVCQPLQPASMWFSSASLWGFLREIFPSVAADPLCP